MSTGADLGGFSMFDLFKVEAETHCAMLNEGLLAIEAAPGDLARIEPLMRAAHSIKGAARIIGLDSAVTLAHAMEDCLVGAQKGREVLGSARIDQLLRGVDLLAQLAALTEAELPKWSADHAPAIEQLMAQLAATAPPETKAPAAPELPPRIASAVEVSGPVGGEVGPAERVSTEKTEAGAGQVALRVSAASLDRMLRLASESMVEAGRFKAVRRILGEMRQTQRRLDSMLEGIDRPDWSAPAQERQVAELKRLISVSEQQLIAHMIDLEHFFRRSEELSTALYQTVVGSRMRPFSEGAVQFPRMIRDLARQLGKQVTYKLLGAGVAVDRDILQQLEAPLTHMLRNAVDHGIETPEERRSAGKPENANIVLEARHHAGMLTVQVRDDGRGIDPEGLRRKIVERRLVSVEVAATLGRAELFEFLFLPNFSTKSAVTEISGRGVGLDVVQSMVQQVSGTVQIDSEPGRGTSFTMRLPVTLSVLRAALVEISGELYAFPLARLERILAVPREQISPVEGVQQFILDGQSIGLIEAGELLQLQRSSSASSELSVLLIGAGGDRCGLVVDRFCGEQDLVVRPLDPRLGEVPHISAAAILESGDPLLIVDTQDLLTSMKKRLGEGRMRGMTAVPVDSARRARRRILVVDDSITVREVERQLLTRRGYDVDVAVDGRDGWNVLRAGRYDLLITDVDMPRMNGIELIRTVRQEARFAALPIIIVSYKDREEDRLLGLEVGASAYLTKGSFHDDSLARTVADLIGTQD